MAFACALRSLQALMGCAGLAFAAGAIGQDASLKAARMVTELAAGTGGDTNLRRLLPPISAALGQSIVLDNRPGAGGLIAAELVARAAPDGHTVLAATQNALIMGRFLSKRNALDVFRDFVPITQLWKATTVVVAGPNAQAKTIAELLQQAKANPGKVRYGTSGSGTSHHFTGEEIQQLVGVRLVHVAYKGGARSMQAALAGEVDAAIGFGATALPLVRAGKLRVLAVVEGQPFGAIRDVPNLRDVVSGFEPPPSWLGIFAPAALPTRSVERWRAAIASALQAPELRAATADQGLELIGSTPEEFTAQLKKQSQLVARIAKATDIRPAEP